MSHLKFLPLVFNMLTYIYRVEFEIRLSLIIVKSLGPLMPCRVEGYKVTYTMIIRYLYIELCQNFRWLKLREHGNTTEKYEYV
jgi:hypothetical protein